MEVNTAANYSSLCSAPNGNLLHIQKDTDHYMRQCNGHFQEKFEKSEVGNNVMVNSGLSSKSINMADSSASVLNGEYGVLATQVSIEYLDIFEIIRAELLAAEAGEYEVIENELLSTDRRVEELEYGEKGAERTSTSITGNDRHEEDFSVNSVLQNGVTSASFLSLGQHEDHWQTNELDSPKHESPLLQTQRNKENGQVFLGSSDADSRDAERAGFDKENVEPSDNGKGDDGVECAQKVEGKGVENCKAALLEDDKDRVWQHEEDSSQGGKAGSIALRKAGSTEDESSNILVVEVIGDVYSGVSVDDTAIGKGNVVPSDTGKVEDGDGGLSQSDKYSEHSEDEEHAPGAFSGPIAFSGMLSYSGVISYSGQIPYSGNLSLHSDSSTSTRSFAFPILASDWNSSPAKIGPPDSRYFRRRRRWRPRFCCRRPTTLFD